MPQKPLKDAQVRSLRAQTKEQVLTDSYKQPTPFGNLVLCLRVLTTGLKLWTARLRKPTPNSHTLGSFAPGSDQHMSVDAARERLTQLGQALRAAPTPLNDPHAFLRQALTTMDQLSRVPAKKVECTADTHTPVVRAPNNPGTPSVAQLGLPRIPAANPPTTSHMLAENQGTGFSMVAWQPQAASSQVCLETEATTLPQVRGTVTVATTAGEENLIPLEQQPQTLRDVVALYIQQLQDKGTKGSKTTARDYRSLFERRVGKPFPWLADQLVTRIQPTDIVQLIRATLLAPRTRPNRSANAIHMEANEASAQPMRREAEKLRVMLHSAFSTIVRSHLDPNIFSFDSKMPAVTVNPVEGIVRVNGAICSRDRILSADEMAAVVMRLGTIQTPAARALECCIWLGGQRITQVLRATTIHYDPDAATLLLFDGKGRRKTPREHLLPVRGRARDLLTTCSEAARQFRPHPSPYLFTTLGKVSLDGQTVSDLLRDVKAELLNLGFLRSDFDTRDLRRTVETLLSSRGISQDMRAHLLSHGLGGVQNKHYDRFDHFDDKVKALGVLHTWIEESVRNFTRKHGDRVPSGLPLRTSPCLSKSF